MTRRFPKGILKCLATVLIIWSVAVFTMGAATDSQQAKVIIDDGNLVAGIKVEGLDIGSLSEGQALAAIDEAFRQNIDAYQLSFTFLDQQQGFTAEQLGISIDSQSMVDELMLVGRRGNVQQRLDEREQAQSGGFDMDMRIQYDEAVLEQTLDAFIATIPTDPSKEEVVFDPSLPERFQFTERKNGFQPDVAAFKAEVRQAIEGKAFGEMAVAGNVVEPDGTPSDVIENTVLISKFTTEYKGSSSNRIHNIKTAADNMNGSIVQPGEIFSTNETFGPRTSSAIWKLAPAIENKVYKDQLGGGVCQASSTLFNAVAMADLEIIEWKHHSWPSTYVDIGCDATINTGTIDFTFKNNTEWPIYIVSYADTNVRNVTVEVWGRPLPDGMSIKIKGERTGTTGIPGTPVYVTDASEVSKGRIGQYSVTYKIWYDKDGNEVKRDTMDKHYYASVAPRVLKPVQAEAPPAVEQPAAEVPAVQQPVQEQPAEPVQEQPAQQPAQPEQPAVQQPIDEGSWPSEDPGMIIVE